MPLHQTRHMHSEHLKPMRRETTYCADGMHWLQVKSCVQKDDDAMLQKPSSSVASESCKCLQSKRPKQLAAGSCPRKLFSNGISPRQGRGLVTTTPGAQRHCR